LLFQNALLVSLPPLIFKIASFPKFCALVNQSTIF
jgi:hypothetical protein